MKVVNINVEKLLGISEEDFDGSRELGQQAKGVNHLEIPLRQLRIIHRASSCAKRGGHVQFCLKPRSARGIKAETFRSRGQLLSRPPTTGPQLWYVQGVVFLRALMKALPCCMGQLMYGSA